MAKQSQGGNWDDPYEGGNFTKTERYRAEAGRSDIIIVLSDRKKTPRHWTGKKYPHMAFYLKCLEEGPESQCCQELGEPQASNTVYILHIAERQGNGEWKRVGEAKVWGFGEDTRCNKLNVIIRDICGGDLKKFKRTRLLISCSDTQFQKISVMAYDRKEKNTMIDEAMKKDVQEKKQMFLDDITIDRTGIIESLQRLRGEDGADAGNVPQEDIGEIDIESELGEIAGEGEDEEVDLPF